MERRTEVPNRELVVYVLYGLGGDTRKIHTEKVAVRCHELFPDSFSWTKYPQLPDKDIVRVALTDARKDRHGALVEGRSGQRRGLTAKTQRRPTPDGWRLTQAGIAWVKGNEARLSEAASCRQVKEHRQSVLRHLARVRRHQLYQSSVNSPSGFAPALGEMANLLRCRVDADSEIWRERLLSLRLQAETADQEDVIQFLDACEKQYRLYTQGTGGEDDAE